MTLNQFIWTDLSTYDMAAARLDYAQIFGWKFAGDDAYDFALKNEEPVAAIFPMPKRLAEMKMPSFWMSYVHVADVAAIVDKARQHTGAIIEVEPQPFSDTATIALIRDPSGAGFTAYQGADIRPKSTGPGIVRRRYHHVPSLSLIAAFYTDLFGWRFEKRSDEPWPLYDIVGPEGRMVAQVEEVPETIRGTFRYWMPCFDVAHLADTQDRIAAQGGQTLTELSDTRIMCADRQGGHFMVAGIRS